MLIKMFFDTVPLGKMSRVEMSFGQMPRNRDENREKGKKIVMKSVNSKSGKLAGQ